jgi:hypothetical protein
VKADARQGLADGGSEIVDEPADDELRMTTIERGRSALLR